MSNALTTVANSAELSVLVAVIFVVGMAVSFRGFDRAILSKLPYQPLPGLDTEQAMVEATIEGEQSN